MSNNKKIMDAETIRRAINRIAQEIVEWNSGAKDIVIVGLYTHGVYVGERLAATLKKSEGHDIPCGSMDITLYRDDVGMRTGGPHLPERKGTEIPFDITDKTVVLVDDVVATGRSIRAALDQLMDLGRPKKIQLVGLIDRGGRELPIRPDFVGREISLHEGEFVRVRLVEKDGIDEVIVEG